MFADPTIRRLQPATTERIRMVTSKQIMLCRAPKDEAGTTVLVVWSEWGSYEARVKTELRKCDVSVTTWKQSQRLYRKSRLGMEGAEKRACPLQCLLWLAGKVVGGIDGNSSCC